MAYRCSGEEYIYLTRCVMAAAERRVEDIGRDAKHLLVAQERRAFCLVGMELRPELATQEALGQ